MRLIFYYKSLLVLLFLLPLTVLHSAENKAGNKIIKKAENKQEAQWTLLLKKKLNPKEIVTLTADSKQFLALFQAPRSAKTAGAIIMLHGQAAHPDWPDIIQPLREKLPDYGWATLSVQLPILAKSKPVKDYTTLQNTANQRIQAALVLLKNKKYDPIIILGYGLGANTAYHFIAKTPKSSIKALISISMLHSETVKAFSSVTALSDFSVPVFDIYAYSDRIDILKGAKKRKMLVYKNRQTRKSAEAKKKRPAYRQLEIEGADHRFTGYENRLVKRIRSWLFTQFGKK